MEKKKEEEEEELEESMKKKSLFPYPQPCTHKENIFHTYL